MRYKRLDFLGRPDYKLSRSGVLKRLKGDRSRGIPYRWVRVIARPSSNAVKRGKVPYLRVNVGGRAWLLHCLVLETFVGSCPPGMEARHLDGNHENCNLSNLKWGTRWENAQDKKRHGRTTKGRSVNRGSSNGMAYFTDEEVAEIRADYSTGNYTYVQLAEKWHCSHWTIGGIIKGHTYT